MKNLLRSIKHQLSPSPYGWFGNYKNWDDAMKATTGYDSSIILNKVREASLKAKTGEAAFERDSVLFYEREYSWPLVGALFWIAAQNEGKLGVMDFGGSLGSTYYQYRHLFEPLKSLRWCIIEQKHFVDIGRTEFEDDQLRFYTDMQSCLSANAIHIFLSGCVLPYVKQPYEILETVFSNKIPFIIIDRMPFIDGPEDRLTVQKVPPAIYEASYPAWFFSYTKFTEFMRRRYEVVAEYECQDRANIPSSYKGQIFKLRT